MLPSIKKATAALARFITTPFSAPILPKTLALAALIGLYQVISWTAQHTTLVYYVIAFVWVYKIAEMILFSWALMLPYKYLGKVKWLYYSIIIAIFALFTLFDTFFLTVYAHPFDIVFSDIIMGTNPDEAAEFFQTFMDWNLIMHFILALSIPIIVYIATTIIAKHIHHINNKAVCAIIALAAVTYIACAAINIKLYKEFGCIPVIFLSNVESIDPGHPIQKSHPTLSKTAEADYDNICIIIGESLSPSHMSLYGYHIPTTPKMDSLLRQGTLFTFTNVKAPNVSTGKVFKSLLNIAQDGDPEWYTKPTLIEVSQLTGHHVTWISNQNQSGVFDNIPTRNAEIADKQIFTTTNKYTSMLGNEYDSKLLPLLAKALTDSTGHPHAKQLYILHLMGNHTTFNERYPHQYQVFKPDAYSQFPAHQQSIRADYDNSILYNDFIVSELIAQFAGTKSIVIYFPDHSLDFFVTDPKYFDHGKPNDPTSYATDTDIPFIIYMTTEYQAANPQVVEAVKQHLDTPFNTTDLTYTVMDIMGVNFTDTIANGSTATRSLLRLGLICGVDSETKCKIFRTE